jgi:hypothetical protein
MEKLVNESLNQICVSRFGSVEASNRFVNIYAFGMPIETVAGIKIKKLCK